MVILHCNHHHSRVKISLKNLLTTEREIMRFFSYFACFHFLISAPINHQFMDSWTSDALILLCNLLLAFGKIKKPSIKFIICHFFFFAWVGSIEWCVNFCADFTFFLLTHYNEKEIKMITFVPKIICILFFIVWKWDDY